jgi:hypothetical protein
MIVFNLYGDPSIKLGSVLKPMKPNGPTYGKIGKEYTYFTQYSDPDDYDVYYYWDWGDGSNSGWIGPYKSGDKCEANHTWTSRGPYQIKVKAKDINNKETSWSDPLPIKMSKIKFIYNVLLNKIKHNFHMLYQFGFFKK